MAKIITLSITILCAFSSWASDNWPDWRGPEADGHSVATGLPLAWSETDNIAWKTAINGLGHSTPVVWGNRIWLTTADEDGSAMYAVCINLDSGAIVHNIKVFEPVEPEEVHSLNSYATPSAVVEEGRVYVHFGTYGTACLDSSSGKILWRRTDLNCRHLQGPASSPILFRDMVIVSVEGMDLQTITALNKKTGETAWQTSRPDDIYADARPLNRKAYQTPVILSINGKPQLISNGSLAVMGYEPNSGKEIWRAVYGDDNTIARVVAGDGLLFVSCGGTKNRFWAVRQGGTGDVTKSHVAWELDEDMPLNASPLYVESLLYTISDKGHLTCIEAKTGETVWKERLRGEYGASPLYADGRIYISDRKGKTTVFKPGRAFEKLAENQLDGSFSASPAVAGKSLLLRTKTHLYRIKGE